jgi:hypothetical protein
MCELFSGAAGIAVIAANLVDEQRGRPRHYGFLLVIYLL